MNKETEQNKLLNEGSRLRTFKNWPLSHSKTCNAQKMAEAGFYCPNSGDGSDSAECFLCKKQLDGWEDDDDPWVEHINHAKYCLFAQCGKAEKDMTVKNYWDFCYQFALNKLDAEYKEKSKMLETEYNSHRANLLSKLK